MIAAEARIDIAWELVFGITREQEHVEHIQVALTTKALLAHTWLAPGGMLQPPDGGRTSGSRSMVLTSHFDNLWNRGSHPSRLSRCLRDTVFCGNPRRKYVIDPLFDACMESK